MIQVTVEYSAQVRRAAGVAADEIEVADGSTIRDAVDHVCQQRGRSLQEILFNAAGELHPSMLIFVDDNQVLNASSYVLEAGARVTLLSPVSGG